MISPQCTQKEKGKTGWSHKKEQFMKGKEKEQKKLSGEKGGI